VLKLASVPTYEGITVKHILEYFEIVKEEDVDERQNVILYVLAMDRVYAEHVGQETARQEWLVRNNEALKKERAMLPRR
jgi:hypothetical protein